MESIPPLESIPTKSRFHAILIPTPLVVIPIPIPILVKNGIIPPLVGSDVFVFGSAQF